MAIPQEPATTATGDTFGANRWNEMIDWVKYKTLEAAFEAAFVSWSNSN